VEWRLFQDAFSCVVEKFKNRAASLKFAKRIPPINVELNTHFKYCEDTYGLVSRYFYNAKGLEVTYELAPVTQPQSQT
jgi:hypothetical protein